MMKWTLFLWHILRRKCTLLYVVGRNETQRIITLAFQKIYKHLCINIFCGSCCGKCCIFIFSIFFSLLKNICGNVRQYVRWYVVMFIVAVCYFRGCWRVRSAVRCVCLSTVCAHLFVWLSRKKRCHHHRCCYEKKLTSMFK